MKLASFKTFADNPSQILMLAKVAEARKIAASEVLKIKNDFAALEIDAACAYRLMRFENERERDRFKALSIILGVRTAADGEIQDDNETLYD